MTTYRHTRASATTAGPTRFLRGLTVVVALYGLVLQALLGSAAAHPVASPFDGALTIHCLQQDGSGSDRADQPADSDHRHGQCCTLAHWTALPVPPVPAASVVVWPVRVAQPTTRRFETAARPRGPPPRSIASPRAPPVV